MSEKLIISCSPHIRNNTNTQSIMRDVILALLPALAASVWVFGLRALLLTIVCVATCVASEYIFQKGVGRDVTVSDLSAALTGMLLAFNLPVNLPFWMAIFGSIVAIVVVKQLFGGIGMNFANPAITARIVMLISFTGPMTTWIIPDAVSGPTPLALLKDGLTEQLPPISNMLLGMRGGSLGETSVIALLLGGLYLLYRQVISWHIPVAFIGTVGVLTLLFGANPMYQLVSGGLFIGAFFMATDYSTSPFTAKGKLIFGVGCGLLTAVIRVFGAYPEGVSFAILLMNILCPHIDNMTSKKVLGGNY